jgi:hypothetical protein
MSSREFQHRRADGRLRPKATSLAASLLPRSDALRLTGLCVGGLQVAPLLDSGSAQTWLPAWSGQKGLQLAGGGPGECQPVGSNFSAAYADGTRVSGPRCVASLSLRGKRPDGTVGRIIWSQIVGAATVIVENAALSRGGRGGAQRGVFALSPALESSLWPLLFATPHRPSLTIAAASRLLWVGDSRGGATPVRLCSTWAGTSASLGSPNERTGACLDGPTSTHWNFHLSSVEVASGSVPPHTSNNTTRVTPLLGQAAAQLDTGATHIAAPQTARTALLLGSHAPAALALALSTAAATPKRLLLPLSYSCDGPSSRSHAACLRATAVPMLPRRRGVHMWVLGLPFFRHHDVTMRVAPAAWRKQSQPAYSDPRPSGDSSASRSAAVHSGCCCSDQQCRFSQANGGQQVERLAMWGEGGASFAPPALEVLLRAVSVAAREAVMYDV